MSKNLRAASLAILIISLFWVFDSVLGLVFFKDGGLNYHLFHASSHQIYIRLLGGIALAFGIVTWSSNLSRSRQNARELANQKEIYDVLMNSGPDCILVHRDYQIIFTNRNSLNFFQLEELGAFEGASIFDFILPEFHDQVRKMVEQALHGQAAPMQEIQIRKLDGHTRDIAVSSTRINWSGQQTVLTFFRDITEDLHNRRDLTASGERLQLALDAARDGVWDWDIATGRMVYSNSWASMLGYSLEETPGNLDTWRALIHPADYLRAQTLLDNHLRGLVPGYEIEVRLRHKKGHYIWILDRGKVVERDEQGNPLRMTGTHRNITARKEAELALEIRNQIAEAFLTGETSGIFLHIMDVICKSIEAPVGLFATLDTQETLHIISTIAETNSSHTDRETSTMSFSRNKLPDLFDRLINNNRYVIQNEPLEITGHSVPLNCVLGVPVSNHDQVLGAILVANKAGGFQQTDRLFLESLAGYIAPILLSQLNSEAKEIQLRQAQKMEALGALAGGIAHDFNNILQAIMGFTTLALEDAGQEGTIPGDLKRVLKATWRGQDLVQRILLFSRREEHKYAPVDIQSVVNEAVNLLKPSIPATIEIRSELKAEGARVFGDEGQISQIILNLATNAFHAMEADGGLMEIHLHTHYYSDSQQDCPENLRNQDLVVLSVSDTGVGMSEVIRARLFDPFFTTKEVGLGTGLGMSVVHGIVKAHQGEIHIHSELATGTNVQVFLPLITDSPTGEFLEPAGVAASKGSPDYHIVIVDDEPDITALGKALLEKSGYRVTAESNGRKILAYLEEDPEFCDLVITDLTMPQITGFQLAERLGKVCPGLPIILITGMSEEKGILWKSHPNIKELIHKPFGGDVLRSAIDRILKTSDNQKEF